MSELQLRAVVAERQVDVEFSVAAGEVLAVLGPNGAGKSTVLHVIAGLLRPDRGAVRLGERVLTDTAAGINVPTHDRRVGLLLQDALLFPHMSVAANVAFGPHSRRARLRPARAAEKATAARWLREVDAERLADRKPRQLSGGQAQRVAIARALAAEPDVLLLDEPLAGLDVAAAAAIRAVLRQVISRTGCAAILVTHDLLDVFTLADRVLVLESGKAAEIGPVPEVLTAPRSHFAARIAGINLVNGTVDRDGSLLAPSGDRWYAAHDARGDLVSPEQHAIAVFPPTVVAVYRDQPHGSPRNAVEVTVAELDIRGSAVLVRGAQQPDGAPGLAAEITADAAAELRLAPGDRVWFSVKAHEVTLYPAAH
ncbi:sulfate/molybdate ABC transporter ATP-binding protein [Mycobacterium marseillense]|uniref:Molybdenum ABC transporter ATP-binding protein n=1 Tax=Mycobacterium marseillense TaxID=701042 RepID=A0AAC9YKJ1_9MYCO|nr:sulfate/molybdate ABC transporter ATP-binding protein [Mycobacterium marseillense]ASW90548.1 molybdenum ABC transporter ATP-binding protein [Mycobacterium marseillense]MCV7403223.1 sulfate/molybdate ABC transporter ATP-binding protein [Mycobacterium marseillense]MDM3972844.1 sulfate/molybdate ABC transporter ATP-binding protein [Mycobacterium marseillense]ORA88506.1 molybdenum ABC transporter ATP-binding protein [Mycobacterium marseillense]BBY10155.1 molybdenum import ATP-binding protein Mo